MGLSYGSNYRYATEIDDASICMLRNGNIKEEKEIGKTKWKEKFDGLVLANE
jgi:hypothetical protein